MILFGWFKRLNNIQIDSIWILNTEVTLTPAFRPQLERDIERFRFSYSEGSICIFNFQAENDTFTRVWLLKYWWLRGLIWQHKTNLNTRI